MRAGEALARRPRHVGLAVLVAGFLAGAWTTPPIAMAGAVALLLGAVALGLRPAAGAGLAALLLVAAIGGAARADALAGTRLASAFGRSVDGDVTVTGAARTDPGGGRRMLVRFRGEPVLLRLAVWQHAPTPPVGAIVAVRGTLRAPDRAARALRAHAVLRAAGVRLSGRRRGGLPGAVDTIRRRAELALRGNLPPPEAALMRGMVLGEDDALPTDLRDAFRAAGLAHLVAASGQNVMLLAALALAVSAVAGFGVRTRWLLVAGLIALYVPLAGAGPSIQRAGVMGAATVAAALAGRPASRGYALLLAAAITLGLDPRAAGEAGWQLSFAAVAGIALLTPAVTRRLTRRRVPTALAEAVAVTTAATLVTAPLMAVRFGELSLVALPANVLAAPAVAPVMWLGMTAAALGQIAPALTGPPVALAALPLGYLVGLGRLAGSLSWAQAAVAPIVVTVLAVLLAVALRGASSGEAEMRPPHLRRRHLLAGGATVAAALALLLIAGRRNGPLDGPAPDTLRVTALSVGQGDATLLQAGGHAVLVDAGPPGAPIVARLRAAGVRRLDALVVTHPQADHEGGAPAVLGALRPAVLLDGRDGDRSATSRALDGPLRRAGTRVVGARAGEVLRAGPLTLHVLWPPPGTPAAPGTDPNERAIVAVASADGARVLLTADAESDVLDGLALEPVDVLKVSHHGSADPGLPALLTRLRPRVALIEVGAHNVYGHPAPSTLRALHGVPVVRRTDRDGSVAVDLAAGRMTLTATG